MASRFAVESPARRCTRTTRLTGDLPETVIHIGRVGYLDFVQPIGGAERVTTDAARVQKEVYYLDTAYVTLRKRTAWLETVTCGWNILVGTDP